jgi:hypothetical protein
LNERQEDAENTGYRDSGLTTSHDHIHDLPAVPLVSCCHGIAAPAAAWGGRQGKGPAPGFKLGFNLGWAVLKLSAG